MVPQQYWLPSCRGNTSSIPVELPRFNTRQDGALAFYVSRSLREQVLGASLTTTSKPSSEELLKQFEEKDEAADNHTL